MKTKYRLGLRAAALCLLSLTLLGNITLAHAQFGGGYYMPRNPPKSIHVDPKPTSGKACRDYCFQRLKQCLPSTNAILNSGVAGYGSSKEMAKRYDHVGERCVAQQRACEAGCR